MRLRTFGLLCVLALVACTRSGAPAAGHGNAWTIPGVLRIGAKEEPDSLNLMFGHTVATDQIDCLLFSFILRTDDNGNLFPDLATEVPTVQNGGISRDGKTIVIHLRHGVKWSDGAPLTAADWLFTYHAVLNPKNNTKTDYGWNMIASATAPNPYTIVIHLKKPTVQVLGILTMGGDAYPPLPAHLLAKLPDINRAPFNSAPISSGPYLLKAWNHESSLEFVPNPLYFRGPPHLKEIIWKIIPDPTTLLAQLRTHEIDVYPSVDSDEIPDVGTIPGIRVVSRLVANWRHLGMNMSKPQLSDGRVRAAIAEGVDWGHILATVYHGYGVLAVSDIFPQSWAAPTLPPYRYDPADARRLLAAAGWRMGADGVLHKGTLAMRLGISTTANAPENEKAELVIQSMLRPLGIEIDIHNYPPNVLFAQTGPVYGGRYDLEWSVETNGADPDDSGSWNSRFIPPNGANTSWLRDPIVDRTSDAAASTYDEPQRKALYQQEAARLRELNPSIFVYWERGYVAMNSDLRNYRPAAFIADEWNAWQWEI
jgi:peptide/nickel transport system substrate-binding protein